MTTKKRTGKQLKPVRWLLLGAALLFLLWLGLKSWRLVTAAQSLQNRQAEATALLAGGLAGVEPNAVEALILGLRSDVVTLKTETAVFLPLAPYLSWLPKIGPTLAVAPQLVEMADAGTEMAVYALRGFKPALIAIHSQPPNMALITTMLQAIDQARPELAAMQPPLDRIIAARNEIGDLDALPWRVRTLLEQVDEWLPLAQDGLKLAPYLPAIMGREGQRRYLILAQNEDELRPTGGFISGAGLLTVENGRIVDLNFLDASQIDAWGEGWSLRKPYELSPQPLKNFMLLDLFLFRDANFWPDFPTSAEKAMWLYSYGQDVPLPDGVVAIDQHFLQLLIAATGPVNIPDSDLVIDSQNVIPNLQESWAIKDGQGIADWVFNRKGFIGVFASAIRGKVEADLASIDLAALARNMIQAVRAKHLQIYLRDPAEANLLNDLHWDGRLPVSPQHDFLMFVDTNMGYSKSNLLINQNLTYQVQIKADDSIQATVSINYRHDGQSDGEPCSHGTTYNLETAASYQNLVNECYWNYLRLYTPPGSQLLTSSRHTVPGSALMSGVSWDNTAQPVNDLSGLTTFANFFLLPPGEKLTTTFTYKLPASLIHSDNGLKQYRLDLFKQAGTRPQPVLITVTLPAGAVPGEINPTPTDIMDTTIRFAINLVEDSTIVINYHHLNPEG